MAQAAELAYSQIRGLLIAGHMTPGTWLREEDLAERTGVSRTPVREALRRLEQEGFVDFRPRRGAQVVRWTDQDLDEIFSVRALLESYGASQAAEFATSEHLAVLTDLCDQMDDLAERTYEMALSGDGEQPEEVMETYHRIADLNYDFHKTVLSAAGNAHLRSVMRGLISMPLVQRTFMRYSGDRLARSMSHHRELVDALTARDSGWASSVMNAHVRSARVELY